MNFLDHAYWFGVIWNLLVITAATIGLAFLAARWTRSAYWQRTIWQIAFVSIGILGASEVTGLTKGLALWFGGKKPVAQRFSVRTFEPTTPALELVEEDSPAVVEPTFSSSPIQEERSVVWPGFIWIAGAVVILSRVLFSQALLFGFRFRRESPEDDAAVDSANRLASRLGLTHHIAVRQSPALRSPIAFGIFRKTIVLPEHFSKTFNPVQREAVLAHELAHLAFNDPAWYLVADCVTAFFWWNPLVWLARQKLHAASENAADEASLLVQDGATTLAECLVHLAKQFASSGAFGWMSIEGNGFRSNLARRIERLLSLQSTEWRTPRAPAVVALKVFTPIVLITLAIVTSALAQRDRTQPGNLNAALHQTWNDSIGALALNAVSTPNEPSVVDEPPAAKSTTSVKPNVSPSVVETKTPSKLPVATNDAVVTSIREADVNAAAAAGEAHATTNVIYTSVSKKKIWATLQSIKLESFSFGGQPLGEVVRSLTDETYKYDPKKGINFMIDKADLAKLLLPNVTLKSNIPISDILNEMCRVAPLQYRIEDYAVVIATNSGPVLRLFSRVFMVNAIATTEALKKRGLIENHIVVGTETAVLNGALRNYFAAAGVDLKAPRSVFFNDQLGKIIARGTTADLETIAQAIDKLIPDPAQLTVEVKVAEISDDDSKALGFDWFIGDSSVLNQRRFVGLPGDDTVATPSVSNPPRIFPGAPQTNAPNKSAMRVTGVLTEAQMRVVVRALETRTGVDLITMPRVTTLSGRQAQISSLDSTTVVTGVQLVTNSDGTITPGIVTMNLPFGPVMDFIPDVSDDGFSIRLTAMATFNEFVGYEAATEAQQKTQNVMTKTAIQVPLPKLRMNQTIVEPIIVWDRQTIILSGFTTEASKDKSLPPLGSTSQVGKLFGKKESDNSKKKHLVFFITPTIIDPAGNVVHTLDDMDVLTKRTSLPPQEVRSPHFAPLRAMTPGSYLESISTRTNLVK
ncbi:MAG: Regulatory sensor-transducer, BlaR1/MecR1 family [Verrucomicrobiales bacterium]|nr:Regulatory sensor-transducer, BlaR1/MecR1 family [Verrucomicrobiales bacterium]